MLYNCYQMSDVRRLVSDIRQMTSHISCLIKVNMTSDIWCHMSDSRHLMCNVWFQTSDIYRTSDVCYQTNDIRCVIAVIWQQTSAVTCLISHVWCRISDIRCLMFVVWLQIWWCQTSDIYQTFDVRLLTYIRRLLSNICFLLSDVIYDIRRLM